MGNIWSFILSITCIILFYNSTPSGNDFSENVFLSSMFIQIFSIFNIFSDKTRPYTLKKIFFLFALFFLGIAPILQFYDNTSFFGARPIKEKEFFLLNILIIAILILYSLLYNFFKKFRIKNKTIEFTRKLQVKTNSNLSPIHSFLLILLSLLSFFLVFEANNFNILSMLIRDGELKEISQQSFTRGIIIFRFFQPIAMMCFLYALSKKTKKYFVLFILGFLALITCSPTGMPRFAAAAMYIPLLLLNIPFLRKQNIFSLVFILGLIIVFPFLNNFRNLNSLDFSLRLEFDMFTSANFDNYYNFALVLFSDLKTYGRQLLGVILFWLPRTIWTNKPIGSGAYLAEELGFNFNNISCNFFAEGFINFGLTGILIFVIFIAYITSRIDKIYWEIVSNDETNFLKVLYFILLGMLFFMLRGDLLSSFAFTVGFILAFLLVYKIGSIKLK